MRSQLGRWLVAWSFCIAIALAMNFAHRHNNGYVGLPREPTTEQKLERIEQSRIALEVADPISDEQKRELLDQLDEQEAKIRQERPILSDVIKEKELQRDEIENMLDSTSIRIQFVYCPFWWRLQRAFSRLFNGERLR